MKYKLLFSLSIGLIFSALSSFAQYNIVFLPDAKSNPGNLNTEDEILNPMPGAGWTVIYSNSTSTPAWSSAITLPFSFLFNNLSVSTFKVSNSGILTFASTPGSAPSYLNSSLPNSGIPDNSVCLWGLRGVKNYASISYYTSARTPSIRTKVFGNSPYRQFWVAFTGFTFAVADTTKAILTNWSIVLEETTNYIYIVDESTLPFTPITGGFKPDTVNVNMTVGIQLNSTTAISVPGSPNVHSAVLNPRQAANLSFISNDNVYYIFRPASTTPAYDAGVYKIDLGQYSNGKPSGINISGRFFNYGKTLLSSVMISYSVNGGTRVDTTLSGLSVPSGTSSPFTTAIWNPASSGDYHIKIWTDHLNGSHSDEWHFNDTAQAETFYMADPPKKRVLVEEFTGTWCGHCPRALSAMSYTLAHQPDAIGIANHVENDPMTNYYTQQLAAIYAWGYPTGIVDRTCFSENGEIHAAMSFPLKDDYIHGAPFMSKVDKQLLVPTPVAIDISKSFEPVSRTLTVTVTAEFKAPATGDLRLNAVLVEDSISGGSTYNQTNYMAGDTSFPYWGSQPPSISGFYHRHVARYNMADTTNVFGTPNVIPSSVLAGQTFSKKYTYVLPANWNVDKMEIVAFVSRYNVDNTKGAVLNANFASIEDITTGSMDSKKTLARFSVYPSPAKSSTTILFDLNTAQEVKLEIFNILGETVYTDHPGKMSAGEHFTHLDVQSLRGGMYIVAMTFGNQTVTKKLFVLK